MNKIKVLIVDDSAFMRKLITEFLEEDSRITVIATARNGKEAISKIEEQKPDVITLDVEMPVMNGLEALKTIMKQCPAPVIMLSSTTREGTESTVSAMDMGAFDFIPKPSGTISLDLHKIKKELIEKVIAASRTSVQKLQKSSINAESSRSDIDRYSKIELNKEKIPILRRYTENKRVVAIGTSTGGPRALQEVLTKLPGDLTAPILVVQHMPAGFTKSLAERLNSMSEITVKEAEDGEILNKATAYIAPGGFHFKVKKVGMSLAASIDKSEIRNGHRPSVDVLFESVSELSDFTKIAVIMTGMGSDGSKGLVRLKQTGNVKAIAESQETSVVFGMPKAAIATGLVDSVENLENIARTIIRFC